MTAKKIPYKATDFIPCIGLITHQFRIAKTGSDLEKIIRKHGNPFIPSYLEDTMGRYMELLIRNWRGEHLRKNFDLKFDAYHLIATAIPLVYGISSYL
jgi:hypothetical protein